MFHFYSLRKRQENFGFLTFSGGIEAEHSAKFGQEQTKNFKLGMFWGR